MSVLRSPRPPRNGGQESTILTFIPTLMHFGMVVVGLPYSFQGQMGLNEILGGSPYGAEGGSAGIAGTLAGIGAGWIGALLLARMFRRDQLRGLDWIEFDRGVILWVRVRSAEREAKAQDILRRNGGHAVRVHEIEIEKRAEDLPLSSLSPDPWLGSEPLGHP
jgi:hypothetical protein